MYVTDEETAFLENTLAGVNLLAPNAFDTVMLKLVSTQSPFASKLMFRLLMGI